MVEDMTVGVICGCDLNRMGVANFRTERAFMRFPKVSVTGWKTTFANKVLNEELFCLQLCWFAFGAAVKVFAAFLCPSREAGRSLTTD